MHSEHPWLLPHRNRFAPTGRALPNSRKNVTSAKPKAESSIRIANVRRVGMISATPVRVGAVASCRQITGGDRSPSNGPDLGGPRAGLDAGYEVSVQASRP